MKLIVAILFSGILLAGCQRKNAAVANESKTVKETTSADKARIYEESKSKRAQIQKDLSYKEAPIQANGPLQESLLKEHAEKTDFKALYESGYQKHNAGDFKGAIADFTKCISINPEFSDAYNFRGMSKYKSGDKNGACGDWNKAVELGLSQAQNMINSYCK